MIVYVCMHCRRELYSEGGEEVLCEDHPWVPAERVNIEDQLPDETQ